MHSCVSVCAPLLAKLVAERADDMSQFAKKSAASPYKFCSCFLLVHRRDSNDFHMKSSTFALLASVAWAWQAPWHRHDGSMPNQRGVMLLYLNMLSWACLSDHTFLHMPFRPSLGGPLCSLLQLSPIVNGPPTSSPSTYDIHKPF